MLRKTILAVTVASFASTAAFAEGGNPTPRMTAEEIETYSTQSAEFVGVSNGIVLPFFILVLILIALGGGGSNNMPMYGLTAG